MCYVGYIYCHDFFTPGAVRGVCRIKRVKESGMAGLSDDSLAPPVLHETETNVGRQTRKFASAKSRKTEAKYKTNCVEARGIG